MKSLIFLAFWVIIICILFTASLLPQWIKHRRIKRQNREFLKKLNGRFGALIIEADKKRHPLPIDQQ